MNRNSTIVWSLTLVVVTAVLALIPAVIIAQGNETMTVTTAHGKASESTRTITSDVQAIRFVAGGFQLVPDMSLSVPDAVANGEDLLLIEFSAITRLSKTSDFTDIISLEIRVDGVAVTPTGPDFAFAGGPHFSSSSHQAAVKVGPGLHVVEVFWDVVDTGIADVVLAGVLDDYTLSVIRSN